MTRAVAAAILDGLGYDNLTAGFAPTIIPEPGSFTLLGALLSLGGLALRSRARK